MPYSSVRRDPFRPSHPTRYGDESAPSRRSGAPESRAPDKHRALYRRRTQQSSAGGICPRTRGGEHRDPHREQARRTSSAPPQQHHGARAGGRGLGRKARKARKAQKHYTHIMLRAQEHKLTDGHAGSPRRRRQPTTRTDPEAATRARQPSTSTTWVQSYMIATSENPLHGSRRPDLHPRVCTRDHEPGLCVYEIKYYIEGCQSSEGLTLGWGAAASLARWSCSSGHGD